MTSFVKIIAAVIVSALPLIATSGEPVALFLEENGAPGKVHALTLAHQKLHPMDGFFYNENYFFIAITEEGYYGYVNLLVSNSGIKPATPAISFTIVTPDKKRLVRDVDFAPEDLVMAVDRFELKLKGNYFRETKDGYQLLISDDGLGMELTFKNKVPGFVLGSGKSSFGSEDWFYINYPGPRPEVTGRFTVDGRQVKVSGWGYIDHSISATNPAGFENVWHNMKFHSDTHTVLISSFTTPDEFDGDFGFAVVTDDEKVLCTFTDVRVTEEEVTLDTESGKPYPHRIKYELVSENCRVRATMDSGKLTEKFDVLAKLDRKLWGKAAKLVINTFIAEPWYFRSVSPTEVEITIDGRTSTVAGTAFNEVIFTE